MNFISILQIIVAVGLLNVWLLRYSKETVYRGQSAKNLKEEFAAYGLPDWFHYVIGFFKIGSAVALIFGLWNHQVALAGASLISILMLGALAMHFKVQDPIKKSVPALLMLLMCVAIIYGNTIQPS